MRAARRWTDFWFAEVPTSTVAIVRIAFGLVTLCWALSLLPDHEALFASTGLLGDDSRTGVAPHLFAVSTRPQYVLVVNLVLVVAAAALTVGCFTRASAVAVFLVLMALTARNPFVFNAGDGLLRVFALYIAVSPAGCALSIDSLRRGRALTFSLAPGATLRLMQLQVCAVYWGAFLERLSGTTWLDGTAVGYALRIEDIARFPVPALVTSSPFLTAALTYGTMAFELLFPLLVWNARLRPWVLAVGVAVHAGIEYSLLVGFFGVTVLVGYLAFLPPDAVARALLRLRTQGGNRVLAAHR